MELTINEVITNLRALRWEEMISYLNNDFLPSKINQLSSNYTLDNENKKSFITCLEMIQTAIANQDVILLCDLLEYELQRILKQIESEVDEEDVFRNL